MNNILNILEAWKEAKNPSVERLKIAEKRAKVCELCEYNKEMSNFFLKKMIDEKALLAKYVCTACGCPLSKKIFIKKEDNDGKCPLNKWEE